MRTVYVADCHIGNPGRLGGEVVAGFNERGRQVLQALEAALIPGDFEHAVVAGDLFDTSAPTPQLMAAVMQLFQQVTDKGKRTIYVMRGNHDMVSDAPGDDALGPLEHLPDVFVVREPMRFTGEHARLYVPFRTGRAAEWLPKAIAASGAAPKPHQKTFSLVLHLGIRDAKTAPWLREAHDAIDVETLEHLAEHYGFTHVFAGNWHEPKQWKREGLIITQIGCTAPTGWDNPGLDYGTRVIHDTEKARPFHERVVGPRFLKTVEDVTAALQQGCKAYIDITTTSEEERTAAEAVMKAHPELKGQISEDAAEAMAQLRTATGLARSATTVEEAIAKYVQEMPLPEGVDRPRVLAAVKRLMVEAS